MIFKDKNIETIFKTHFIPFLEKTRSLVNKTYHTDEFRKKFGDFIRDLLLAKISILDAGKQYFELINGLTFDKKQINDLLKLFTNNVPLFEYSQNAAKSYSETERKSLEDFWNKKFYDISKEHTYDYDSFMEDLKSKCHCSQKEDRSRSASAAPIFESNTKGALDSFLEEYGEEDSINEIKVEHFSSENSSDLESMLKEKLREPSTCSILGFTWTVDESADELLSQLPSKDDLVQMIKNGWTSMDSNLRSTGMIPKGVIVVIAPKGWKPNEDFIESINEELVMKLNENNGEFFIATFWDNGNLADLTDILRDPNTKCTNPFYEQNLG